MEMPDSVSTGPSGKNTLKKALLFCGIIAPVLYVASDIVASISWEGYSYMAQSVSETRAIGSPTRPLLVPVLLIYALLETAFALGVWGTANQKRSSRITAVLLFGLGVVDLIAPFFPMHLRGTEATLTDTMHIIVTIANVILILLVIGFGAFAAGKRFRIYSFATILILLIFGVWSFMDAPQIAANQPTPWLGLRERVNIYGYMIWLAVLAITLLQWEKGKKN